MLNRWRHGAAGRVLLFACEQEWLMARLSYNAMRNLIIDNLPRLRDSGVFTPELLTAIFWEETGFQNVKQAGGGPAVGFGQVERGTIKAVNGFFKVHFTPEQILANDSDSVLITSMTLSMLMNRTHSKMAALNGYAGVFSRAENKPIPGRWIDCERKLQAVHASDRLPNGMVTERLTYVSSATAIKAALRTAKPNSNPDLAFPNPPPLAL
jgi:hypothetical protein